MSFVSPVWESGNNHYRIELLPAFSETLKVAINNSSGNTVFSNADAVENITDTVIHNLIQDGGNENWFSKLPSHDQLIKRVRHTFTNLIAPNDPQNAAKLSTLLLTPKQVTLLWTPIVMAIPSGPQIAFEDSDYESSDGDEVDVPESDLPPVHLTDDSALSQEEYLLTRLRAAKARVEAEQIRMQYFETTGRMPPDSDSEEE